LLVKLPTFKYKLDEIKNNFSKKINWESHNLAKETSAKLS
jgi:hypothetical protein